MKQTPEASNRLGTRVFALVAALALLAAAQTASAQLNATTNTLEGGYLAVVTFTNGSGTWTPPAGVSNVAVLVVGGGGGGGSQRAGGGGAGGVIYSNSFSVTAGTPVTVTVGAGGAGGVYTNATGQGNGANSIFSTLTANGGGYGAGAWNNGANKANGANGGSGGGASYSSPNGVAGTGTGGQGNNGGAYYNYAGGGGGGAGAVGGSAYGLPNQGNGGPGGAGITNSITGSLVAYGGGGGGGANDNDAGTQLGGAAGSGGGGKGGDGLSAPSPSNSAAGTPNTGGGGGGGAMSGHTYPNGAAGGSGVVIVRYVVPGATAPVPTQLAFTTVPGSGTAAQQGFSVTVTAQDAYGYPANVGSATTVQLSLASGSGTLSGTISGVIASGSSSVTISGVIYSVWDTATLSAATSSGMSLASATTSIAFAQPANAVVSSNGQCQAVVVNADLSYNVTFNAGIDQPVFGGLTGAGSLVLTDAGSGCVSLQVGGNGPATEFDGVLSGCGGLTKVGTNQFMLGGTSAYAYLGNTVVSNGTLSLLGPLPGLYEGLVTTGNGWDTTTSIPQTTVRLSARMANTGTGWTGTTTWGYTGYFNNPASSNVLYTFGKDFDDGGLIKIDGNVLINNDTWNSYPKTSYTLSPGWHTLELRLGQGGGGVGPGTTMKDNGVSVGLGWSTDGGTTWHGFTDPGDGSVLLAKLGMNNILPTTTTLRIATPGVVNLQGTTNTVQYLYIDGTNKAAGTWGSAVSGAAHPDSHFTGNGVLIVSSAVVTVPPAAQLVFSSAPASGWANLPFSVTVQTLDTNGLVEAVTRDTTVQLGVAVGSGSLSGTTSGVIASNNSSVTLSGVLYSAGDTLTLRAATTAGMSLTSASTNIAFLALGYASVTNDGGYNVVITFTNGMGIWTPPAGLSNVEVLVVGGGGGGGSHRGGGGGAGGLIYSNSFAVTPLTPVGVTVGAGGAGSVYTGATGPGNGANSIFSTLTALGGGSGGSLWNSGANNADGAAGASGGGACYDAAYPRTAGNGTAGQGNNGGATVAFAGGGGGGAGAAGSGGNNSSGGAGGAGTTNSITGSPVAYAGGGGGGPADNDSGAAPGGAGGVGGGGKGADGARAPAASSAAAGTPNTGGGGGAGGWGWPDGADGGSGVVIVKYVVPGATPPVPTQLAFTALPGSGTAGEPFSVTVQAQDGVGYPQNVTNNTTVQLSVASGSGTLSGTTHGTIVSGTSSVVISNVIYSSWDTMTLGAATTSGMSLASAISSTITFTQPAILTVSSAGQYQGLVVNVGPSNSVIFNAGIANPEFGGLTGAGSLVLTDAVGSCVSLVVGGSGPDTEFDGVLTGCGGLIKVGVNQFTLAANNTYLGGTVVSNGTLSLLGPLPGLYEGLAANGTSAVDITDPIPHGSVRLEARMADTANGWANNTTWGYAGYFNNPASTDVAFTFGKNFDNFGFILIDGNVLINDDGFNAFTTVTTNLSPGWHTLELRVGQDAGGVGPGADMHDSSLGKNVGLGWSTDGGTNWHGFADPGDGSVLLAKSAVSNILPPATTLGIVTPGVVNLLGGSNTVQNLYIDGTQQVPGTWGSTTSGAANTDSHFTGDGMLVVGASAPTVSLTITPDGSGNYTIGATTTPAAPGLTTLRLYKSNDLSLPMNGFTDTGATLVPDGGGNYHFFPPRIPGTGTGGDGAQTFYLVK